MNTGWKKITTALTADKKSQTLFHAKNYDQLVDCPIEIGNHVTFTFTSDGVEHEVAMVGPGNYNIDKLKTDMAKITDGCISVFGQDENKRYVFIVHNVEHGDGGLEHTNSVSISVNRWIYEPAGSYLGFLGLVAHEYMHQWIVKRLRPVSLIHYDYTKENYTDLLWVMEGFPSYYDDILLCRLGYIRDNDYLNRLNGAMNGVENIPGNQVATVSSSSFDAWIKQYQPDEDFINSSVSYYTKGKVLAAMLDLEVINDTGGKESLNDVLQYLYINYYKNNRTGITSDDLKNTLEKFTDKDMDPFFNDYVYGTSAIDYKKYLGYAGLEVIDMTGENNQPFIGIGLQESGGKNIVQSVYSNSAAEKSGIAPGDEIIGADGFRFNKDGFLNYINSKIPGDTVRVFVSREGLIHNKTLILSPDNRKHYTIYLSPGATSLQKTVYNKWLLGK